MPKKSIKKSAKKAPAKNPEIQDPQENASSKLSNKIRKFEKEMTMEQAQESINKILDNEAEGKPFWCGQREQQIAGTAICDKIQSTQGCKMGMFSPENLTGCCFWQAELNSKATGKKSKKSGGSGKFSYQTIMRAYFLEHGQATIQQLVDCINDHPSRQGVARKADEKNTSVGVSILRNPKRIKNPLTISYSKKSKLYYCYDVEGMREAEAADVADYDADTKAAKKEETK